MSKIKLLPFFILFAILAGGITAAYIILKPEKNLKVFNASGVNPELVDESSLSEREHFVKDFSFINQEGKTITQKDLDGKIYVADFFFTTCPSICPKMSSQMKRIHNEFRDNEKLMLLSHTVMPETDSVPVLAEYAKLYDATAGKWHFLTGEKTALYEMARKSYFIVKTQGQGDEHDFIHTENFVLVDTQKRIRGYYDGTSIVAVNQLIEDIKFLLREEKS